MILTLTQFFQNILPVYIFEVIDFDNKLRILDLTPLNILPVSIFEVTKFDNKLRILDLNPLNILPVSIFEVNDFDCKLRIFDLNPFFKNILLVSSFEDCCFRLQIMNI